MQFINQIPFDKKRVWAEINLDYAKHNYLAIKNLLKENVKTCAVIKANAYGHSAVHLAKLYQELGASYLAVSNIAEAIQLRRANIILPILILGYTPPECACELAKLNLTQCAYSLDYATALSKNAVREGVCVNAHIKIDTGMGRIGFVVREERLEGLKSSLAACRLKGLLVDGVFTHFACADEDCEFTRIQYKYFQKAISYLEANGVNFKIKHCANSSTILKYPEYQMDMVRMGVMLYGLSPFGEKNEEFNKLNLLPVMSLHTVISNIKQVGVGESISYGRDYVANKPIKVATLPLGYADGLKRGTAKGGYFVSLRDNKTGEAKKAGIIGRICMDQLMIDVTDINCAVGEEVVVFGYDSESSATNLAIVNGSINYEIVCSVGERVPRAIIKKDKIVCFKDSILGD